MTLTNKTVPNSGRIILFLILLFVIAGVLVIWHLTSLTQHLAETAARENAERYSEALATVRSRYSSQVVDRVKDHGVVATDKYLSQPGTIPLPATFTHDLGEHIADTGSGANVRLYSDFPFPARKDRVLDEFQRNAIRELRRNPGQPVELIDRERRVLRYVTADRMNQSCVDCHNTVSGSPKTDWKVGDVRGVLEVTLPMDQVVAETRKGMQQTTILMFALGGIGIVGLGLVIRRFQNSSRELEASGHKIAEALEEQQTTNEQLHQRGTELERINAALESQRAALSHANQELEQRTAALASAQRLIGEAVKQLSQVGGHVLSVASDQAGGAHEQATAISQIVATADELSRSAEQAAKLAQEVAESTKQTRNVGQAGRQTVEAATGAMNEVKTQVELIAESILSLSDRAQAIGNITDTVKDIAEQTNVLALNASVEASRAGEHGKGFAVVAAEVKGLADQSKKATAQVGQILAEIQNATNTAVLAIEQGTRSVDRTAQIVGEADGTIGTLVDALSHSSRTADQIRASVQQQAAAVGQLTEGIQSINKVTEQNVAATRQIESAAEDLNKLSDQLSDLTTG